VANLGSKRYYIQSAFSMPTEEKRIQEKASLVNINDSFKKIIIVKDIVTITSPQEDKFVYSYLMNNFDYESAYFGFTDENEEGTWVWDNGEESSYTNWHYGEPNSENPEEDYAMYYYKFSDGTWNDGDFGNKTVNSGRVFICEWGEYEISSNIQKQKETRTISDERDIVLVLDASSSMAGTPLDETKKAATNL
jgi:hypothetical protein